MGKQYTTLILILITLFSGCTSVLNKASSRLANQLSKATLMHNDMATVKEALPAYLLLMDSFIIESPKNTELLLNTAQLYTAYAAVFVTAPERQQRLAERSYNYASQAICVAFKTLCHSRTIPHEKFANLLKIEAQDIEAIYIWANAWAFWIQTHREDWNAIADLSKVKLIMERIIVLDETYDSAGAHVMLGILSMLQPPSLGGKPELSQKHFLRALELTDNQHLMIQYNYAKYYAKPLFKRALHDQLLTDIINAEQVINEFTLMNQVAKKYAQQLLKDADDYF